MASVRMDKWLWAARFFKTRALAARACELGRIQANGQHAKVLLLSEVRGPASGAQTLYRETEASRELRQKLADERKAMQPFKTSPEGRPSKRERREIIRFRDRA